MPFELSQIEVMEISLVDDPANDAARAVMFKSADGGKPLTSDDENGTVPRKSSGDEAEGDNMSKEIEALEVKAATAASERDEATKRAETAEAERDALAKALEGAGYVVDGGKATVRPADDFITIEGERMLKSAVPPAMIKMAEKVEAQSKALAAAEMQKRVEAEIPSLAGTNDAKAAMLSAVDAIEDEGVRGKALAALKSANEAAAALTRSTGFKANEFDEDNDAATAAVKHEAMARDYAAKNSVDLADAYKAINNTPEGKALLKDTMN